MAKSKETYIFEIRFSKAFQIFQMRVDPVLFLLPRSGTPLHYLKKDKVDTASSLLSLLKSPPP